jgi:hypothetical protein
MSLVWGTIDFFSWMTLTISCKAFFVIANSLDESKKMIGQAVAIILTFYFIVNMLTTFVIYGRKIHLAFFSSLLLIYLPQCNK